MSTVAFVEKLNTKSGTSRNGKPYTLFSMKLTDKDGNELPGWYNCAFTKPACKEGDYIKLDATPNGQNFDVNVPSIKVSKNSPAKPAKQGSGGGGAAKAATVKTSELFGDIGGYNTEDDIRRMSYSAARSDALKAVELLLSSGGLKLVKAESKAGAAKCFDIVKDAIDKLTVEYFYDAATGRKLESVADVEFNTEGDGDLPDADEEFDDVDDFADDFEDDDDDFE